MKNVLLQTQTSPHEFTNSLAYKVQANLDVIEHMKVTAHTESAHCATSVSIVYCQAPRL